MVYNSIDDIKIEGIPLKTVLKGGFSHEPGF